MRNFGTLGHPTDASGRYVRGTYHGIARMNSSILVSDNRGNFVTIGSVVNAMLDPWLGVDVSRIRLHNHVSTFVQGVQIYHFHSYVNLNNVNAIVPARSGAHTVRLSSLGFGVWMVYDGIGEVFMRNIIITRNPPNVHRLRKKSAVSLLIVMMFPGFWRIIARRRAVRFYRYGMSPDFIKNRFNHFSLFLRCVLN